MGLRLRKISAALVPKPDNPNKVELFIDDDGIAKTKDSTGAVSYAIPVTGAPLQLDEQGADPAFVADKGLIYSKDVAGVTELFYIDGTGQVIQLTDNGAPMGGGGGGGLVTDPGIKATNLTAAANTHYVLDGSASFTFAFPTGPADGDRVSFSFDAASGAGGTLLLNFDGGGGETFVGVSPALPITILGQLLPFLAPSWRFLASGNYWILEHELQLLYGVLGSFPAIYAVQDPGEPALVQLGFDYSVVGRVNALQVTSDAVPRFNMPLGTTITSSDTAEPNRIQDYEATSPHIITFPSGSAGDEVFLRETAGGRSQVTFLFVGGTIEDDYGQLGVSFAAQGPYAVRHWKLDGANNWRRVASRNLVGQQTSVATQTIDATPTSLGVYQTVANQRLYLVKVSVLAREVSPTDGTAAKFTCEALFNRDGSGVVTELDTDFTSIHRDATAAMWDVTFGISGTVIEVRVTGEAAKTINWRCMLEVAHHG